MTDSVSTGHPTPPTRRRAAIRCVPGERPPARPRRHAGHADARPADPIEHDRRRDRRPAASVRDRGDEEHHRGMGRCANLCRPDDRPALSVAASEPTGTHDPFAGKLSIDGRIQPEQRRRGLFAVNVYAATLDVVAEFQTAAAARAGEDDRQVDWPAARLEIGLSDARSIDGAAVDVDGQKLDWAPGSGGPLSSLKARRSTPLAGRSRDDHRSAFASPRRAAACWPSCHSAGAPKPLSTAPGPRQASAARLPQSQTVDKDGFQREMVGLASRAALRPTLGQRQCPTTRRRTRSLDSAFGVTLLNTDRRLSRDRPHHQVCHHVHRPDLRGLPAVRDGDRHAAAFRAVWPDRPVALRLLSAAAVDRRAVRLRVRPISASAAAIVAQATIYIWALQRRAAPALAFGVILTGLYRRSLWPASARGRGAARRARSCCLRCCRSPCG